MAAMKTIEARRVWRMTSDSPLGEYLELVPKRTYTADADHRVESRTAQPTPAKPADAAALRRDTVTSSSGATQSREPASERPIAVPPSVKVLTPAHCESWQSSSFDLLSGLQVRDVSDTIPGRVFEELFKALPSTVFTKRRC